MSNGNGGFGTVLGDIFVGAVDILTRPLPRGSILEESVRGDPEPPPPQVIIHRNQPPLAAPSPRLGPSPGNSAPPVAPTPSPPLTFVEGGDVANGFDLPFVDIVPQGGGAASTLFRRPGMMGMRPRSLVMVPNPVTGKPTFFRHVGQPILFSGDLRAAKRVRKVAARARKSR